MRRMRWRSGQGGRLFRTCQSLYIVFTCSKVGIELTLLDTVLVGVALGSLLLMGTGNTLNTLVEVVLVWGASL